MDFYEQTVIVTGASGHLGRAVTAAFAAQGARLVLAARSKAALDSAFGEESAARAHVAADLTHSADAQTLAAFESGTFDSVICTLALMDIPDYEAALRAARRVLAPGGWLVLALTHPCFQSPYARADLDASGPTRVIRRYLTEGYWRSDAQGVRAKLGSYHRTLSSYLNALLAAGFTLERMTEPRATGDRLAQEPGDGEFPALLVVRARAR